MLLGRVPQAAEVDYWRGAMAGGMSETAVVQDFVASAEYSVTTLGNTGQYVGMCNYFTKTRRIVLTQCSPRR